MNYEEKEKKFEIATAMMIEDTKSSEVRVDTYKKEHAFGGYFVIAMVYVMIGLYAIIRTLNYGDCLESVFIEELMTVTLILILGGFIVWLLCLCFEGDVYSIKFFLGLSVVLMILIYVDTAFLFNSIARCFVSGEKHWFFVVILPINAIFTNKLCESIEREQSIKNNVLGLICFMSWQIFMNYLSNAFPISYQVFLVVSNALILAGILFTTKTEAKNYGNRFAILVLYVGAMCLALYLKKNVLVSHDYYLLDKLEPSEYTSTVRNFWANVKWFGTAYKGISMERELLIFRSNPLQSIAAYWGMFSVIIYLVIMTVIMIVFGSVVYKSRNHRMFFAVGMSAYANLCSRMVLSIISSLGISPLRFAMPFVGENRFVDYCSISILLILYFKYKAENGYICPFKKVENEIFKKVVDLLVLDEECEDIEND